MATTASPRLAVIDESRDAGWLAQELDSIWQRYFDDTPRVNRVAIAFQRPWKRRLGVIRLSPDKLTTHIGINRLLALPDAPYCVTLITVAHELVHYAHGFGSPLPRKHPHPHRGGVVDRELVARGLASELAEYGSWIRSNWWSFYARRSPRPTRRRSR